LFHPGELGLFYQLQSGCITRVAPVGQACIAGVRTGWVMTKIGNRPYSLILLNSLINGTTDYTITFRRLEGETEDQPPPTPPPESPRDCNPRGTLWDAGIHSASIFPPLAPGEEPEEAPEEVVNDDDDEPAAAPEDLGSLPAGAKQETPASAYDKLKTFQREEVDIPDNEETNTVAAKIQAIQRGKQTRRELQAASGDTKKEVPALQPQPLRQLAPGEVEPPCTAPPESPCDLEELGDLWDDSPMPEAHSPPPLAPDDDPEEAPEEVQPDDDDEPPTAPRQRPPAREIDPDEELPPCTAPPESPFDGDEGGSLWQAMPQLRPASALPPLAPDDDPEEAPSEVECEDDEPPIAPRQRPSPREILPEEEMPPCMPPPESPRDLELDVDLWCAGPEADAEEFNQKAPAPFAPAEDEEPEEAPEEVLHQSVEDLNEPLSAPAE